MSEEKPLHALVAEALGWEYRSWWFDPDGNKWSLPPRYDTDWSATGPLVERYDITIGPTLGGLAKGDNRSCAAILWGREDVEAMGETPLIAVCNLILALKRAGKLPA